MAFVTIAGNPVPQGGEELWLARAGGLQVRVLLAPAQGARTRGSIILCPGRTEFIEKYFEVVGLLQQRGFAVLCLDWRGQGLSGRETKNSEKGHIRNFDDAAEDLAAAVRQYADRLPRPHIVLAHSMGGAIALRALQTGLITAEGAAFSAPMWGIAALKGPLVGIVKAAALAGLSQAYAPQMQTEWVREAFDGNPVTHDEKRHERCQDLIAADPRLALAGATYGWVAAAASVMEGFAKPGALAGVTMPVLIASAEEEKLVDNGAHDRVAAALPNATHITIKGAMHEILMENDATQAPFWAAFDALAGKVAP